MMLGRCCHCEPALPIPPRLFEIRRLYHLGAPATGNSVPAHNVAWTFNGLGDSFWDASVTNAVWQTLPVSDPGPPEIRTARFEPWEHTLGLPLSNNLPNTLGVKFAEDKTEIRRDGDFILPANAHCWPLNLSSISVGVPLTEWTGFPGQSTAFLDYVEVIIDNGNTHSEVIDLTASPPTWDTFARASNPARGIGNFDAALAAAVQVPDLQTIKMRFYLRAEIEELATVRRVARGYPDTFDAFNGGDGGIYWGVTGLDSCDANAQRQEGDVFQLTFASNPPGGVSPLRLEPQTGWNYSTDSGTILMDHITTGDAIRFDWERETPDVLVTMPGAPAVPGLTQQCKYVMPDQGQYRIPSFAATPRDPKSQYIWNTSSTMPLYGRGNANDPQGAWFLGTSGSQGGFPSSVTLDVVT